MSMLQCPRCGEEVGTPDGDRNGAHWDCDEDGVECDGCGASLLITTHVEITFSIEDTNATHPTDAKG